MDEIQSFKIENLAFGDHYFNHKLENQGFIDFKSFGSNQKSNFPGAVFKDILPKNDGNSAISNDSTKITSKGANHSKLFFRNQTLMPLNQFMDSTPIFVNPKQYEAILRMRLKKMKRNLNQQYRNARIKSKRKIKYKSRSEHAKKRKRAPDGKFLPRELNCDDDENLSRGSTILKETVHGSRSRSRSREKEKKRNAETDSIARGLSPSDLQRGESLMLNRHSSTISTDLFKKYEDEGGNFDASGLEEMLFDTKKENTGRGNKLSELSLRAFESVNREEAQEIPKIFVDKED